MAFQKFEDMIVRRKAHKLTLTIYKIFKNNKDYWFKDQIQRASVSITNNIAEGFERKGIKEFSRFLIIAKASCAEVRNMIYLAKPLEYMTQEEYQTLIQETQVILNMLWWLLKSLKNNT